MNYSRVISSFLHFSKNDPVSEEQIQATQNTARNYLRRVFLLMEKPFLSFDFHRFAIPRPLGLLINNGLRREPWSRRSVDKFNATSQQPKTG
jgi:hypothetical protein